MGTGALAEFSQFQGLLAQAVASMSAPESDKVLEAVRGLPEWGAEGHPLPSSLDEVVDPRRAMLYWFDPLLGLNICRLLHIDPREAYDREFRSERLLTQQGRYPVEMSRQIEFRDPALMVQEIGAFMMAAGVDVVSGVFHVASQRLYVGLPVLGHAEIASRAGIPERKAYTRMAFGLESGVLKARWVLAYPDEAKWARRRIQRLLARLFEGISFLA